MKKDKYIAPIVSVTTFGEDVVATSNDDPFVEDGYGQIFTLN